MLSSGAAAAQAPLGQGTLYVAGTRLAISPESQTVPFNTPTIVETELQGFDAASGPLPTGLRVLADFTGPEIAGILPLETLPGEPFRIPRLILKGQYRLDNIRLVQGDDFLAYAEPRSAGVLVTQVLVTRVSSRALSLEEIQSRGIAVDEDSFRAFNFTFGFAVDGEVYDYNIPIVYNPVGPGDPLRILDVSPRLGGSRGTLVERFRPPQLAPFVLELDSAGGGSPSDPNGGCQNVEGCQVSNRLSLPGVILFPTDVSLLNQYFSVVLFAQNDAPGGDPLVIRGLTAKVILPPGLRMAETEPPTLLGVPVPVRVPGPDGVLGTGDDINFLVAQASGQAEVLTEGIQEGTHIVEFQLEGTLDGLAGGAVRRISGRAKGAVIVRDPTLGVTITHPEIVRADEEYDLLLTVSNTSNTPVNLVQMTLPASRLSGVQLVGAASQTIPTLAPGESEVVEFRLLSLRTGRVTSSTVKTGGAIDPKFEFSVGVGDAGIPLSPTSIILPRAADDLPPAIRRHAMALAGLGFSLATAPPSLITSDLPRVGRETIDEKVYWLAQAGRHRKLGEDAFDSLAILAAEWTGARNEDWEWDRLRRITQRGGLLGDSFAQIIAAEAAASSHVAAFERFATTTSFLGDLQAALAYGPGVRLEVASRTTGQSLARSGIAPDRVRDLPFADLYDLGGAEMALLASPEAAGYRLRVSRDGGGSADLHLLLPTAAGGLRLLRWYGVSLGAAGSAEVDVLPGASGAVLEVDADGDGVAESQISGAESLLAPRPFTAMAVVQNAEADPSGHIVEVLFSRDVDVFQLVPPNPQRFRIPGKVSNGGLVKVEADVASLFEVVAENPFEGLRNSRVVRVVFNNPISPYVSHDLTVEDVASLDGDSIASVTLPVQTTVTQPGTLVEGTVFGPDGLPAPFARVDLFEVDECYFCLESQCKQHRTAAVQADSSGRFEFDYVRQTGCADVFKIDAADPVSGKSGTARSRVRFIGQTVQLDVLMLGRGTVRGRVTYEDGTVPEELRVLATSPVFSEGREARILADGRYEVGDVPVGTVTLAATDRLGSFVFQTVEIPRAGAAVERDLIIIRRAPDDATGDIRGTVFETDGVTPVFDAYVALYVDDDQIGVERSGADGSFDFGTVPAGRAEIEAFDAETGRKGTQVFFDVQPDQVNDVTLLLRDDRGVVEGHVYLQHADGSTEPLAGAVVWVSGSPFNTLTDATGFYRLEDVFAGDRTLLAADLERQEQTSTRVTVNGDGSTTFRDLYFREDLEGSGIAGEVVDYTGNPVAGAFVHINAGNDQWYKEAFTDLEGRFILRDLGPGSYQLNAYKGVDGAAKRATIRFEGETPFVRIQFKKGTIRGTVRAVNEVGQTVGVRSLVTYRTTVVQEGLLGLDWEPHTLETEDDGSFEIPNVLAGRYVLTVSNAFHGEKTARGELEFHGEVIEKNFLFEPNGTIRGVVLDHDGVTPVAGAQVVLRHPSFSDYDLVSDENGAFTFELVPPTNGRFSIDVLVDQGVIFRKARVWARLTRFGQELDVEVVLPKQATVSGFVEDAGGYPVPGAVVTLREHSYPNRKLVGNTDEEGQFSFTNVFQGEVSIVAKAPSLGGLGGRTCVQVLEEGEEVFGLVSLEPTGEVTGKILNPETGERVPSAAVTLHRGGTMVERINADENGEFRFRLLPLATYRVWAFDPSTGRHGYQDGLALSNAGEIVDTCLELEVRGEVDGHLYERGSGVGVPGATIRLAANALVDLVTYSSTDVDGYFEFFGIPEGSFRLSTREPEGRRKAFGQDQIEEEGARVTVDLYLEASGRVVGTVLNPPGLPAGPFPNVNVLLDQDGQTIGATLDNPFAFGGVIADRKFTLNAREVGGSHRARASGTLSDEGEEVTLDLQIVPIGNAAVTVRDSFGNPVSGADVRITATGFYGTKLLTGSSGPDGRAVFAGVGEGHVSAYATNPQNALRGSGSGSISLEGETTEIVIDLQDSGSIQGRVLLSDGITPAAEALVVLTRGSRVLQTRADENGDFDFETVPLGSFTVFTQENFGPGTAEVAGTLGANGQVIDLGGLVMDDEDPYVVSLTPATASRNVALSTAVTVTFNEPLDPARYAGSWFRFRTLSGSSVAYTPSWSNGDRTVTLTPNASLASFKGYEVTVMHAVDLANRDLFERVRTVFYTVDVVPPAVIEFTPRDGQKQIPVSQQLKVTISEPVVPASLSGAAFQLTDLTTGQGVSTTFVLEPGERQVVLTPAGGLATDREYELTVQGVQDGSGNTMSAPLSTRFWSVDTVPPQITAITFPAGTGFTAGDDVPVSVTATDLHGVAQVRTIVGDWTFTDDTDPWDITALAPVVSSLQAVTVTVEAVDVHGNIGTATSSIDVSPLVNASPPDLTLACAQDGDVVVPGQDEEVRLLATDDIAVESYAFFVDGVLQERSPQNTGAVEQSFLWEPPADGVPGDSYVLRLEARDFAGNVSVAEATVHVATGRVLKGGRSLFDVYGADDLVLAAGEFLVRDPLSFASLTLIRGASITVPDPEDLVLTTAGQLRIKCGAAVDVSVKGFGAGAMPNRPAWVQAPSSRFGGSHGGLGAQGDAQGSSGEVFDSVYQPTLSGAAGSDGKSAGGGTVHLQAGDLLLDGEILARGEYRFSVPSGAGGTVSILADSMSGIGHVLADGESSRDSYLGQLFGGSGGGGRVALRVGDLTGFDPETQVSTTSKPTIHGEWGDEPERFSGAGTVFWRQTGDLYGRLLIDPGLRTSGAEKDAPPTPLPSLGTGAVLSFQAQGADAWLEADDVFRPRWLGTWVGLTDGSGASLGAFEVGEVGPDGRLLLSGGALAAAAVTYRGEYRFDEVRLLHGADLITGDPLQIGHLVLGGQVQVSSPLTVTDLTLRSGGELAPADGSELHIQASGVVTIEEGAVVQVSELGVRPPWANASSGTAGGSHGGAGSLGDGAGPAGDVYDSVYRPSLAGGEGDGGHRKGGGVVHIEAAELRLDGTIQAKGDYFYSFAGGAGGTVLIETGTLTGTGAIDASGADGRRVYAFPGYPGGGGGGRIAIRSAVIDGFDPLIQAKAKGGSATNGDPGDAPEGYASPGTVFVRTASDTYGILTLDQGVSSVTGGDRSAAPVELPPLGEGAVTSVEVAGSDLWISAPQPFLPRWWGAWVTLLESSGGELGTFEAVEADESGRLLLLGASAASSATAYRGEYRFDAVRLLNGAGIVSSDPLASGDMVLQGDVEVPASLRARNVEIRAGALVRPVSGAELSIEATGILTIEAGAVLDVTGIGSPPPGLAVSGGLTGASHGGSGAQGQTSGPLGETYGSVYEPRYGGAFGGNSKPGGGVVRLEAAEINFDGEIRSRGTSQYRYPGAAGGTVVLKTGVLRGSGSIDTSGAEGRSNLSDGYQYPGSGSGGRVALIADVFDGFDPALQVVNAGVGTIDGDPGDTPVRYSAPGTVFVKQATDIYGELQVLQPVPSSIKPVAWTELPSIGKGVVGVATVEGADLWIEPEDPAKHHSIGAVGMWVRIGDQGSAQDYRVLDEAEDRRGLLLEGAAGAVQVGDPYQGVYKFDRVTVAGNAKLRFWDGDEVGQWTVDAGASLELFDLELPTVAMTEPAAATVFASGQLVKIAATAADDTSVSSVTFSFGGETFVDSSAPYEWIVPAPPVLAEQDELIRVEAQDPNANVGVAEVIVRVRPAQPGDVPALNVASVSVLEGASGETAQRIPMVLSSAPTYDASVSFLLVGDTAAEDEDFLGASGTITFPAGSTTVDLGLTVLGDLLEEGDETLRVVFSDPFGIELPAADAIVTIYDDDTHCFGNNLLVNGDAEEALEAGEIPGWTEVIGSSWTYRTNDGVALSGLSHFFPGAVANGELAQDVDVSAYAAWIDQGEQQLAFEGFVRSAVGSPPDLSRVILEYRDAANQAVLGTYDSTYLESPSGWARLQDIRTAPAGTRWVRIRLLAQRHSGTNNDGYFDLLGLWAADRPSVQVGDAEISEGDSGSQLLSFAVTRGCDLGGLLDVSYATADGSATAGSDYQAASGTLNFADGEATKQIDVEILSDLVLEDDETFQLSLATASSTTAALSGGGLGTILDDDDLASACMTPNLLVNGGGERIDFAKDLVGWTEVTGTLWTRSAISWGTPLEGTYAFDPGDISFAELRQDVDVSAFAPWIGLGTQQFLFEGSLLSYDQSPADKGRFIVEYRDSANTTVLASYDSGYVDARSGWQPQEDLKTAPAGTAWIRVRLLADRNSGTSNDALFDALSLRALNLPHVFVASADVDEDTVPSPLDLAVTLACSDATVTVDYSAMAGTAAKGADFLPLSGQVTLGPGPEQQLISVTMVNDSIAEFPEAFSVDLSSSASSVALLSGEIRLTDGDSGTEGCEEAELVVNGGFEDVISGGVPAGWTAQSGTKWAHRNANPAPTEGSKYVLAGAVSWADLRQFVDLSARASEIDAGRLQLRFAADLASYDQSPADTPRILLTYFDSSQTVKLGEFDTGYVDGRSGWQHFEDAHGVPRGTRWVRFVLQADRNSGTNNDAYFDGISLKPVILPLLAVADASVAEGDSGTASLSFSVTASCVSDAAISASFTTLEGTATAGTDFVEATGTVTLAAGATSGTVTVDVVGDTAAEGDETFGLELSAASGAVLEASDATGTIIDDDGAQALRMAPAAIRFGDCPREGDGVAPGSVVSLPYHLASSPDDREVVLSVNGEVVERRFVPASRLDTEDTFQWVVSSNALAADLFLLRLEAIGEETSSMDELTVRVPAGDLMIAARNLREVPPEADLVLAEGNHSLTESLKIANLTLLAGARLSAAPGAVLEVAAAGTVTVQCGASIDHSRSNGASSAVLSREALPLSGTTLRSATVSRGERPSEAGGSHGGQGTSGELVDGVEDATYDSLFEPSLPGAAGARVVGRGSSVAGGGLIVLSARQVRVDGAILATGGSSQSFSGAGGSIWIRAEALLGTGVLDVRGGALESCEASALSNLFDVSGGAGGGGRVALHVGDLRSFEVPQQIRAGGGAVLDCAGQAISRAGAGTIFLRRTLAEAGELLVVQGDAEGPATATGLTPLPGIGAGVIGAIEGLEGSQDLWIEAADGSKRFDLGVWGMTLEVNGRGFLVLDQSSDRRRLLLRDAAGEVLPGDRFEGLLRLDRLTVRGGAVLKLPDRHEIGILDVDSASQVVMP